VVDSAGRDLPARLLHGALRPAYRAAVRRLDRLGAALEPLTGLGERQSAAERSTPDAADLPTARASASLFAQTAALAGAPHNGRRSNGWARHGRFLYWNDAYRDLATTCAWAASPGASRMAGALSGDGRCWLLGEVEALHAASADALPQVEFARSRALVTRMLLDPIAALSAELGGQAHGKACRTHAQPLPPVSRETRRRRPSERSSCCDDAPRGTGTTPPAVIAVTAAAVSPDRRATAAAVVAALTAARAMAVARPV
jgi:hypothetical protein